MVHGGARHRGEVRKIRLPDEGAYRRRLPVLGGIGIEQSGRLVQDASPFSDGGTRCLML